MEGRGRTRDRARSFLLGGLVGASAVAAAVRRSRRRSGRTPAIGLGAFEEAPCYEEAVERERQASSGRPRSHPAESGSGGA